MAATDGWWMTQASAILRGSGCMSIGDLAQSCKKATEMFEADRIEGRVGSPEVRGEIAAVVSA